MEREIDWAKAELHYVTGNISLGELAKQLDCSPTTVKKYSAKGGWRQKRNEYRQKVVRKATSKTATKASSVLGTAWRAAGKLVKIIDTAADGIAAQQAMGAELIRRGQALAEAGEDANGEELAQVGRELMQSGVNAKDLQMLAGALDRLTVTVRNAADVPTKAEKAAMDIARERLALDKQKAAADQTDGKHITITMEGDMNDFAG